MKQNRFKRGKVEELIDVTPLTPVFQEAFIPLIDNLKMGKMLANDPLVAEGFDSAVTMINMLIDYINVSDI